MTPLAGAFDGFWSGRRVFLTGHTGFKGAWLSLMLEWMGAEVTGYALAPNTTPSLFDLAGVAPAMKSLIGDINDAAALTAAMEAAQPDLVLHLAAQPLVRESFDDPAGTYQTNVMGTLNSLEAVRRTPSVRVVLVVSTDKCYLNRNWIWGYREDEPLGGHDPYSSSKACTEILTASYRDSFFTPNSFSSRKVAVATARAGNVIGGGDWAADRLVPDAMRAFAKDDPLLIRYPHSIRPWQHVIDPLRGYLTLAAKLWGDGDAFAGAWNFGPPPGEEWPVQRIAEELAALWGDGKVLVDNKPHKPEDGILRLDPTKARDKLGWRPAIGMEEALRLSVDWYKRHQAGGDLRGLMLDQCRTSFADV